MVKTIHQTLKKLRLHSSVYALASCLAISGMAFEAHAAGLGKISVFSSLGQPLRAEIEVKADREELSSMRAQLAPPELFKQAGLDYASTLLGIKFSLDQRKDGQHIIKLTSDLPINDPFIDLLLELNWASGRLVREYTFLLDPKDAPASDPLPVVYARTAPSAASGAAAPATASVPDKSDKTEVIRITPREPARKPSAVVQREPSTAAQKAASREVRQGDTLFRIATEMKPADVSLEQMLIGLYEANKDAFLGNNMNRLKAGRVLTMPDRAALDAIKPEQARRTISAQAADWNAYRNRLAAAATSGTAEPEAGSQASAGKVSTQVGEKTAPVAASEDKLVIAAATTPGKGGKAGSGKAGGVSEADRIANEKTLQDAQKRITDLEQIVRDLESLTKIQAEALAKAQKDAETAGGKPVEASPAVTGEQAPPALPKTESEPAPQPQTTPTPPAAADTQKSAEPPAPVKEPRQRVTPKKPATPPPPPPPEEKGLVEEIIDGVMENITIIGGALVAILLLVFGMITVRKRRTLKAALQDLPSTPAEDFSNLMVNSVFHSTGGQSVDTSSNAVPRTDFSQAGPGTIDTDEVDPVAEADVYMAYGRDVQAEEILLEARQKDPRRTAIILKLLEIYQGRKDARQFESLASELYSDTGGSGPDWEKAVAMGRMIVPENPMFGLSAASMSDTASASSPTQAQAMIAEDTPVSGNKATNSTVTMPGALAQMADQAGEQQPAATVAPVSNQGMTGESDLVSLDFDLGFDVADEPTPKNETPAPKTDAPFSASALDFELADTGSKALKPDFGLDFDSSDSLATKIENVNLGEDSSKTDADASLDALTFAQPDEVSDNESDDAFMNMAALADTSIKDAPGFNMSSINLDLDDAQSDDLDLSEATQMFDINTLKKDKDAASESEQIANSMGNLEHELLPEQDYLSMTSISGRAFDKQPDEAEGDLGVDLSDAVSTKIDLAKAYEDMGDLEGARELLQEVINEGTPAQKEKAQEILAKISK